VRLRSYDDGPVGPTLRLRAGDELRLRLSNKLSAVAVSADPHECPSTPAHFNVTNLHTHGLHVSPQSPADNVLLEIYPEGSDGGTPHHRSALDGPRAIGHFDYVFRIPPNHPPGTHWYHGHHHGAAAVQVASGMVGALLIEGDIDDVPEIAATRQSEKVFLFQQVAYVKDGSNIGRIESFDDLDFGWSDSGGHFAVNGVVHPKFVMAPGEIQRWRFIHAGIFEFLSLEVLRIDDGTDQQQDMHLIAMDGISIGSIEPLKQLPRMSPGNRLDVLFKAPGPGMYVLRKRPEGVAFRKRRRGGGKSDSDAGEQARDMAIIEVTGSPVTMDLPRNEQLAALNRPVPFTMQELASARQRTVEFDEDRFTIDGECFDMDAAPRQVMVQGSVEKWTVKAAQGNHPFHIHVNPFLIGEPSIKLPQQVWKDTQVVFSGQEFSFYTRLSDFSGKFVIHCHNLQHEDQGMMQLVEVVPSFSGSLSKLQYYPQPRRAPDVAWQGISGRQYSPRNLKGQVVLLNIWATWCSPCVAELPSLQTLRSRYAAEGLAVLAVSLDPRPVDVEQFFHRVGIKSLDVLSTDRSRLRELDVTVVPTTFMIDRGGFLRAKLEGSLDWQGQEAEELLGYFMRG
jgi:FtsP/CotA-like multicopper oxidase with cupredoxin domain/peroxiredoxin